MDFERHYPGSVTSRHHIAQALDSTAVGKYPLNLLVQLRFFNSTVEPIYYTLYSLWSHGFR